MAGAIMNCTEVFSKRLARAKLWRKCDFILGTLLAHSSLLSLPASKVGFADLLGPILEMDCQVNQ